jgi:hypothetical protein
MVQLETTRVSNRVPLSAAHTSIPNRPRTAYGSDQEARELLQQLR